MDASLTIEFRKIIFNYVQKFKTNDMSFDFETYGHNICMCVITDCIKSKGEDLTQEEFRFIANRFGDLISDYCNKSPHVMSNLFYDCVEKVYPCCSLLINGFNKSNAGYIIPSSKDSQDDKVHIVFDMLLKEGIGFRRELTNMLLASQDYLGEEQQSLDYIGYPRYYMKSNDGKFYLVDYQEIKSSDGFVEYYKQYKKNDHLYETHYRCNRGDHCMICDGGLSFCEVCKKGECELTNDCCGHTYPTMLSDCTDILYDKFNYVFGKWIYGHNKCTRSLQDELTNKLEIERMISCGYVFSNEDLCKIREYYYTVAEHLNDDRLLFTSGEDSVVELDDVDIAFKPYVKCEKVLESIYNNITIIQLRDAETQSKYCLRSLSTLLLNTKERVCMLSSTDNMSVMDVLLDDISKHNSAIIVEVNSVSDFKLIHDIRNICKDEFGKLHIYCISAVDDNSYYNMIGELGYTQYKLTASKLEFVKTV